MTRNESTSITFHCSYYFWEVNSVFADRPLLILNTVNPPSPHKKKHNNKIKHWLFENLCVCPQFWRSLFYLQSAEHWFLWNVHFCSCSQQQAGQAWHSFTLSAVIILDLANKPGECNQPWALSVWCPAKLKCHCGLQALQLTRVECVTGEGCSEPKMYFLPNLI